MNVSRCLAQVACAATLAAPSWASLAASQRVWPPSASLAAANCAPGYVPTFGAFPGTDDVVRAARVFDDGTGPALYVGGDFENIAGVRASVAKWDGVVWSALPGLLSGLAPRTVHAFEVWDDGTGPALFVGGNFSMIDGITVNDIAKWDGASWHALGNGLAGSVFALTVFDDGSGSQLVAGGSFPTLGNVMSWDGVSWQPLGAGTDKAVRALETFDAGAGNVLYAGGDFFKAGAVNVQRIASWDGASWSNLGTGTSNRVCAFEVWDDGTGAALYVGGDFTNAGGVPLTSRLARWDGAAWSSVTGNIGNGVNALVVGDDLAGGTALWVGGPGGNGVLSDSIARWNGANWSTPGPGVFGPVYAIAVHDAGAGPHLWVGGSIETSVLTKDQVATNNIASWDGSNWSVITAGLDGPVAELIAFDDGSGPSLFAAGGFEVGGTGALFGIGRWDGTSWHPLGTGTDDGVGDIFTLGAADLGAGPVLFVGGSVRDIDGVAVDGVAQWDGASWSALGQGVGANASIAGPYVGALQAFDEGGGEALFVGGRFTPVSGGPADNIARWDGVAWSDVGGGVNDVVFDLLTFDDGGGPALFACGSFTLAGGVPVSKVARWDGTSWSPLGAGLPDSASDLESFDDGSGAKLHVAAGRRVHRWTGAAWQQLGPDLGTAASDGVFDLAAYDDGSGPALFASGRFKWVGGVQVNNLTRWDGSSWQPVGSGTTDVVYSLEVFDSLDGSGPGLYVGSDVSLPGQEGLDSHLFLWTDACDPPTFYCTPKASSAGCFATIATSAASQPISGAGDYLVSALNAQSQKPGILLAGISGPAVVPFFGGVLCLQPPWKRGPFVGSGGVGANTCTGVLSTVVNTGTVLPAGLDGGPGNTVWHQYWYRDPANGAGGFGTALSDAVRLDYR